MQKLRKGKSAKNNSTTTTVAPTTSTTTSTTTTTVGSIETAAKRKQAAKTLSLFELPLGTNKHKSEYGGEGGDEEKNDEYVDYVDKYHVNITHSNKFT